jgi:hypothetical protein
MCALEWEEQRKKEELYAEARAFEREEHRKKEDREAEDCAYQRRKQEELAKNWTESGNRSGSNMSLSPDESAMAKTDEQKDNMNTFLERFEHFALAQKWHKYIWAVGLSPLLTGKDLDVYTSMPASQASDYDELKKALIKRYQLMEKDTDCISMTVSRTGERLCFSLLLVW